MRGFQYENLDNTPTVGDRTMTFTARDQGGNESTPAVATISVTATNDAPVVNLDPDNSGGGANDGNFRANFVEGQGAVAITDAADATASSLGENDVTSLTLLAANFVDGADERLVYAGQVLDFDADDSVTVTNVVPGVDLDVSIVVGGTSTDHGDEQRTFAGGVPIPDAALDALLRDIQYDNTSTSPTTSAPPHHHLVRR